MRGQSVANRIRKVPTIAIAVMAFFAVFSVLVGDVEQRYVYTFAGNGESGAGGDGGPATEAQLSDPRGLALDGSGNLYVADAGAKRVRVIRPPGERSPATQESPHFGDGDSNLSDLVLVNVDTKTITPVIPFYGSTRDPISTDGAFAVKAGIKPLGEWTISTHGRGALTSGSVGVVSGGYVGGFLRFDSMAVGVAGVGAAEPLNDALFPARREAGGINTRAAVRHLASKTMMLTCHLMQSGNVLEIAMVGLGAEGQQTRFINELFPDTDTSDFTSSVRCTVPAGKKFMGVAVEMDFRNRTLTTIPLVPLRRWWHDLLECTGKERSHQSLPYGEGGPLFPPTKEKLARIENVKNSMDKSCCSLGVRGWRRCFHYHQNHPYGRTTQSG